MHEEMQNNESEPEELDAIQRMNLERKIAAGIFVVMMAVYGVYYFFLQPAPQQEYQYISFPEEMNVEGEDFRDQSEVNTYIKGPSPL